MAPPPLLQGLNHKYFQFCLIYATENDIIIDQGQLNFREAQLLFDNSFYVSSEIERITEYEKGFPGKCKTSLRISINFYEFNENVYESL